MKNYEVLSPAGDVENLKVAIKSGADAVYFGLNKFNARMKADNISLDNLTELVDYAHLKSVKMYVTINTLVSNSELKELVDMVGKCIECGVDAFIVQDYGVIGVLKSVYPNIVLHGSTQLGVHNVRGARVAKSLGLSRVVLSREVTLEDIEEISKNVDIELEVFVQGAMCVCFSGNCYLSSLKFGASGNRGICKQLCRLPYTLVGNTSTKSGYVISPRDNCMVDYIDKLMELGVVSFKIEGRLRRKGYVATATRVYRELVDSILNKNNYNKDEAKVELSKVFSRGEFVAGYFETKSIIDTIHNSHTGEKIGKIANCEKFKNLYKITIVSNKEIHSGDGLKVVGKNIEISFGVGNIERNDNKYIVYGKNYVEKDMEVYRILDNEYENQEIDLSRKREVNLIIKVKVGENLKLKAICGNAEVELESAVVDSALNKPTPREKIVENISKWDKEIFNIKSVNFEHYDENSFIQISSINELRRRVSILLINEILKEYKFNFIRKNLPELKSIGNNYNSLAIVDEDCNINNLNHKYSTLILSPKNYSLSAVKKFWDKYRKVFLDRKLFVSLPIIALKNDLVIIDEIVEFLIENKIGILANNIYALDYISLGAEVMCSHNMNVTNDYSINTLVNLGVEDIVFSCEKWTSRTSGTYKLASGKKVLMTFAHCPNVTLTCSGCDNAIGNKINSTKNACCYNSQLKLQSDNNTFYIRRYKIYNCYFELLDEYREDNILNNYIDDLRK